VEVSSNGGYSQIIHLNRIFYYKQPSILGYPHDLGNLLPLEQTMVRWLSWHLMTPLERQQFLHWGLVVLAESDTATTIYSINQSNQIKSTYIKIISEHIKFTCRLFNIHPIRPPLIRTAPWVLRWHLKYPGANPWATKEPGARETMEELIMDSSQ